MLIRDSAQVSHDYLAPAPRLILNRVPAT